MIDKKIIEEAAKVACEGLTNKEYFDAKNKFMEGAEWYGKQVENLISNAVLADDAHKNHELDMVFVKAQGGIPKGGALNVFF